MPSRFDREKAKENLKVILDRLYNDTDLALLKDYKKFFKKEIFLLRRSDVAAWLFMYYDCHEGKNQIREEKTAPAIGDTDSTLPVEESRRLFISIGKNRRLFPREIISLIISKTSALREDIGSVRILDNFSFVQVRDTKADEIIQALHGLRFRGRTLVVNYAKPRSSADAPNDE